MNEQIYNEAFNDELDKMAKSSKCQVVNTTDRKGKKVKLSYQSSEKSLGKGFKKSSQSGKDADGNYVWTKEAAEIYSEAFYDELEKTSKISKEKLKEYGKSMAYSGAVGAVLGGTVGVIGSSVVKSKVDKLGLLKRHFVPKHIKNYTRLGKSGLAAATLVGIQAALSGAAYKYSLDKLKKR